MNLSYCFIFVLFLFCSCNPKKVDGETLNPTKEATLAPYEIAPKIEEKVVERFVHFVAVESKPGEEKEAIKPEITNEDILNSTYQLYVEVLPNGIPQKWSKGNDPERSEKTVEKEKVRAVCLGMENDSYVFLTLRYFLDFTYPNHNVQGISELPTRSQKISAGNAKFVSYSQFFRIWLSDVSHTGGGQISVNKTLPFAVKNDFELYEVSSYDLLSSYSQINGVNYVDPIKGVLPAVAVATVILEINKGQVATLETFGNHDVCLIKVPKKFWGEKEIKNLGLKNPSTTIKFLTEKQKELYGFQFILLSKEAYQAVLHYEVPDSAKESGIYQLALFATAVMGIDQVVQIKLIDKLLLRIFKSSGKNSYDSLSSIQISGIALDFSKEFLNLRSKGF